MTRKVSTQIVLDMPREQAWEKDHYRTRMRDIEARIHIQRQRMPARGQAMVEHPPFFLFLRMAPLAITKLHYRMRGQAAAQRRRYVFERPVDYLDQRAPEGLLCQRRTDHIGAGDDQGVQPLLPDPLKGIVILVDMGPRRVAARPGCVRRAARPGRLR